MDRRNTLQIQRLTPKQQALKDLERARSLLASHIHLATQEWNPRTLVQRSFKNHIWAWAAAAGVGGFVMLRLLWPSGRGKIGRDNSDASAKKSGLIALILSPLFVLGRQAALRYGTQYVQSYLRNHLSRHEGPHAPVRETPSHV